MLGAVDKTLTYLSPAYALSKIIIAKVNDTNVSTSGNNTLAEVRAETERQENEMKRLEAQAKVAQEMAIASRIENASEVQIEEIYEYGGEGMLGAQYEAGKVTAGLQGSVKRVSKRIYRFIGSVGGDDHEAVEKIKNNSVQEPV